MTMHYGLPFPLHRDLEEKEIKYCDLVSNRLRVSYHDKGKPKKFHVYVKIPTGLFSILRYWGVSAAHGDVELYVEQGEAHWYFGFSQRGITYDIAELTPADLPDFIARKLG